MTDPTRALLDELDGIWQANTGVDADGYTTLLELVDASGWTKYRTNQLIEAGLANGLLECSKVPRMNRAGVVFRCAAYRIKTK